uniref:Uncharacterized protein n=1 Tax=Cacopsylla melanoneura TaxID=428564 RepID=A0A8D8S135_9HEMI
MSVTLTHILVLRRSPTYAGTTSQSQKKRISPISRTNIGTVSFNLCWICTHANCLKNLSNTSHYLWIGKTRNCLRRKKDWRSEVMSWRNKLIRNPCMGDSKITWVNQWPVFVPCRRYRETICYERE